MSAKKNSGGAVLSAVRKEIDAIDEQIVELLNRRARVSKRVGRIKAGEGGEIFKPLREEQLLRKLEKYNQGPLPDEHLRAVYREIISSSRALQKKLEVVYLGPEGTFTHFAGMHYLGTSCEFTPRPHIAGVFAAVHSGEADFGVVPLENSLQGTVGQTLDCFYQYDVHIHAEVYARISHSLMSAGEDLSAVAEVHSHPKALEQCEGWLRANLSKARLVPAESTAAAARTVAKKKNAAAIGHKRLTEMFGLNTLASPIEDLPDNWTRFLVIGGSRPAPGEGNKTSVLFTTPDEPGALARILNILAEDNINLSKLESRPLKSEKWKYVFFADMQGDLTGPDHEPVMKKLADACLTLRVLGCYPEGPQLDARG